MKILAALLTFLLLPLTVSALGDSPAPLTGAHAFLDCAMCHVENGTVDCDTCHTADLNPHPVGVAASMKVPPDMPLGPDGLLRCYTCHRIHGGKPGDSYLRNARTEHGRRVFCYKCHEQGMAGINPHDARQGASRCLFCHPREEGGTVKVSSKPKEPVNVVCRFCHGVRDSGHAELLGVNLPDEARRVKNCATCHDPHGTSTTLYDLRPEMAGLLGRVQEKSPHEDGAMSCRLCHVKTFEDDIRKSDVKLLYNDNLDMLCLSCHIAMRSHHPTGGALPGEMAARLSASGMKLPLTSRGRISCYTCHDNGCTGEHTAMRMRYYDSREPDNRLCFGCHDPAEFAGVDPHSDSPGACVLCHETRPVPGVRSETGLMALQTMVCLRCHAVKPHPAGAHHVGRLKKAVNVEKLLPLGPEGEITCTTCHDPHYKSGMPVSRLRRNASCTYCHRGK